MLKRTYEIWDVDTQEMLVDNLTFDEAAEQCAIYMEHYGDGICVAIRESAPVCKRKTYAQEYKEAWISYFAELQAIGNLH